MNIGENIRNLRKSKKMSAKDLSNIIGCSPQAILQYERGERNPSISILNNIATALQVSMDILLNNSIYRRSIFVNFGNEYIVFPESDSDILNVLNYLKLRKENMTDYNLIEKSLIDLLVHVNKDKDLPNISNTDFNNMLEKVCDLIEFELFKITRNANNKIESNSSKTTQKENYSIYEYIISNYINKTDCDVLDNKEN